MELSNYQAFMECMRKWEKIGCNILCGLALWEQMQDCDRRGVPYTDIDIEAVSQDVRQSPSLRRRGTAAQAGNEADYRHPGF